MYDYHVHERHSSDASFASVKNYVQAAEKLDIKEIAFTTHLITAGPDVAIGIRIQDIPEYIEEIEREQKETKAHLLIGFEVDYFPEEETHLEKILDNYSLDFVLGSVHCVNGYNIGDRGIAEDFFRGCQLSVRVDEYYKVWKQAVESGLFDVMAHPDYWKKYIHLFRSPPKWSEYGDMVYSAIDSLKAYNVGFEVNTSGKIHGVSGFFPAQEFLLAAHEAGVNIVTIGSDSHSIGTLCYRFNEALNQLKNAGFTELALFKKQKIRKISL